MLKRIRGEAKSIAVAAVTAALVAGGPAVAAQVVAFAKRAGNADKVDGIHASRKPQAGKLLPLGKNKKFPASVLPLTTGPPGPQGPPGDPSKYSNVVVVAKNGGDFTSVQAAVSSITDASATNRYLVKIAPGIYNERVVMREYVDLEGSGVDATKITYPGNTTLDGTVATVGNTELRFLTVESTGSSTYNAAIMSFVGTLRLTHVTASASGAVNNHGVRASNSSVIMDSVLSSAFGAAGSKYGMFSFQSSVVMRNSMLSAAGGGFSYGLYTSAVGGGYNVDAHHSQIVGGTNTINSDTEFTIRVGASQLSGGPMGPGGTITCAGVYDENFAFLANTCPA